MERTAFVDKLARASATDIHLEQVNMVMSTMLASVAEGVCLSDSLGLDNSALIEVLSMNIRDEPKLFTC